MVQRMTWLLMVSSVCACATQHKISKDVLSGWFVRPTVDAIQNCISDSGLDVAKVSDERDRLTINVVRKADLKFDLEYLYSPFSSKKFNETSRKCLRSSGYDEKFSPESDDIYRAKIECEGIGAASCTLRDKIGNYTFNLDSTKPTGK